MYPLRTPVPLFPDLFFSSISSVRVGIDFKSFDILSYRAFFVRLIVGDFRKLILSRRENLRNGLFG